MEYRSAGTGEQIISRGTLPYRELTPVIGRDLDSEELGPLDRPSPEAFERLARLACSLLGSPAAYVSLVKGTSQVVRGCANDQVTLTTRRELPLSRSICEVVVRTGEPFVINDARVSGIGDHADVIPEFGGVAYAAVPLLAGSGKPVGCLCVAEYETRLWTEDDLWAMRDLAACAASEIELAVAVRASEQRAAEAELARREKTALLEAVPEGIFGFDAGGRCTFINRAASAMLGFLPAESIGRELHEIMWHEPPDGAPYPPGSCPLLHTLATGNGIRLSGEKVRRRNGTTFLADLSAEPVSAEDRVIGGVVTFSDISERERQEARRRFLVNASNLLSASLDYETTLSRVARLAVPAVADICIVYISQPDDSICRLAVCASDPAKQALLNELRQRHPISLHSSGNGVARVMRSGRAELLRSVGERQLREATGDESLRHLLRQIDLRSLIIVPLVSRGRTLGAIALAMSESGRVFEQSDLAFSRDVAHRAAMAIDNAQLYRDASIARHEAEAASQAKSAFLAVMSHELRTPLSAILGYAELLVDGITGPVSEAQQEQLTRVKTCAGQLLGLIDEILSFARLEAEREELRLDIVELGAMTRVAAALVSPRAAEKGLAFELVLPAQPVTLETDPGKVGQILVNLLNNAVKFTEQGWVRLDVRVDGQEVLFEVSDSGIGIEPAHQERIFEDFWQIERPETRAASGAGIGLSVVRRLSRLLGGSIEVRSRVGNGSVFTLRLPLREPAIASY